MVGFVIHLVLLCLSVGTALNVVLRLMKMFVGKNMLNKVVAVGFVVLGHLLVIVLVIAL